MPPPGRSGRRDLPGAGSFSPHVRANQAPPGSEPPPAAALPVPHRCGGRRRPGPRTRTLAAGGAVLAQVWGFGLGLGSAQAVAGQPPGDTVQRVESVGRLGRPIAGRADGPVEGGAADLAAGAPGSAPGAAGGPGPAGGTTPGTTGAGGAVDELLHNRIKAGGLPLPGQVATVPDAFAIAAVLLPAAPAAPAAPTEGRGPQEPPRVGTEPQGGAPAEGGVDQADRAADASGFPVTRGGADRNGLSPQGGYGDHRGWGAADGWRGRAVGVPGAVNRVTDGAPAEGGSLGAFAARIAEFAVSRNSARSGVAGAAPGVASTAEVGAGDGRSATGGARPRVDGSLAVIAPPTRRSGGGPLAATGSQDAVLIPIAAGLLLTGAAMYKHRGLPRGH
ncbi:hypothetical protein GCM10009665_68230 [Kitasatospora nipponensis]|uniref:LPXTG-motif cell wall-anchored protein n=1 Tax=Kitasatospora nipponensis TaxID=258049 RepID=A0ABP4HJP0_9ACTN